jgi:hypothetical protein
VLQSLGAAGVDGGGENGIEEVGRNNEVAAIFFVALAYRARAGEEFVETREYAIEVVGGVGGCDGVVEGLRLLVEAHGDAAQQVDLGDQRSDRGAQARPTAGFECAVGCRRQRFEALGQLFGSLANGVELESLRVHCALPLVGPEVGIDIVAVVTADGEH